MRTFGSSFKNLAYLAYRWITPFLDPITCFMAAPRYIAFFRDWLRYSRMEGAENIRLINTFPLIHDRTATTVFDRHYFYQDIWAFGRILESRVGSHVDVGSRVDYAGFLSTITKVTFIDIRPLDAHLENLESLKGSVLDLPYEDLTVSSLSCLHVAEHVGLGRYGDPLDPLGTRKACRELARVLAYGGNLYFSLPVGKPRLCFNGHRIHSPHRILEYFDSLKLAELSGVTDTGSFIRNIDIRELERADYACGLFQFIRA
jgi:hypothetical protein